MRQRRCKKRTKPAFPWILVSVEPLLIIIVCGGGKVETGLFFSARRWYNRNNGQHPAHNLLFGGGILILAVKRKELLGAALIFIFFLCSLLCAAYPAAAPAFFAHRGGEAVVYVLDAGHGGEDGGAVSRDGVPESEINLAIAKRTELLLRFLGADTVMTRTDDVSIHSEGADTLRQKKASDLRNRVALVNGTPGAVLVSIHQNSLPSVPSVHGAQAFYGAAEPSGALALSVQDALNQSVNIGNKKQEKKIDSSIYLMKNVTCPAILVECGFLSNAAETRLLQDAAHQKLIAASIVAGLLNADTRAAEGETP